MHKIRICIPFFLITILSILCISKISNLIDLENQKECLIESRNQINKLVREIKINTPKHLKSKEKLFSSSDDMKKCIKEITKELCLKKILIKCDSTGTEIKILANQEQKIYYFIDKLFFELPGLIYFKSIKLLITDKGDVAAVIQFTSTIIKELPNISSINVTNRKYDRINLFKKTKQHQLFCTISDSKAYIDDSWFSVEDHIDDYIIKTIKQNFIEIQKDTERQIFIKLGSTW
ncbi:MAG: hypothetical protein LBB21_03185 [Holosporaceae bacterium]|jgi:hypothetical protein|nr:hypothetical protein [Holosporaceae bacterium]